MKQIYLFSLLTVISYFSFAQTPDLLKDINTFHSNAGAPSELVTYNGYVYFVRDDNTNGSEIWRTDGSTTEMFTDIDNTAFGDPYSLIVWNGNLYFSTDIQSMWKTDGNSGNITQVTGPGGQIIPGENVLFLYDGDNIYVTNGTDEANLVATISTEIVDREIKPVGDNLYFVDQTTDEGKEVHFVDITDDGGGQYSSTVVILDNIISGAVGSDPANLTALNGKCYWVALKDNSNGNGTGPKGLYESDGTLVGTTELFTYETSTVLPLYNTSPKTTDITVVNNKLLYYNMTGSSLSIDVDVYAYDGTNTPSIIQQVTNGSPGGIPILNRLQFYGKIAGEEYYYIGGGGTYYKTDGSTTSTTPLDFNQLQHINKMVEFGSELIYTKFDDDENLYKSDLSGNESIVYTFTSTYFQGRPKSLRLLGSEVFFIARDDMEGSRIWKTDGTEINTERVTSSPYAATFSSSPQNFFIFNDELYFTASDGSSFSLYKTDGTTPNTTEVINSSGSLSGGGVTFDNAYFFGASGNNLKKTDGSTVTTISSTGFIPTNLTVSGNSLFFTSPGQGTELWVSDGTDLGTEEFDLFPGGSSNSFPDQLVDVNGTLYFRAVDPNEGTKGLWKSDGTLVGTEVVFSDIIGDIGEVAVIGENIFFTVDDLIIGEELKVYNTVTEEVTEIDLWEGSFDASPSNLNVFNGYLYLNHQLGSQSQQFIKLDPSDFTTEFITSYNATSTGATQSGVVITSDFISYYISDNLTSYSNRITASKNDVVSIQSNTWGNPVAVEDMVFYEDNGILYSSDGFNSNEIGTISGISGNKVSFGNALFFPFDDGNLGLEPHKYEISTSLGFDLTSSSGIQFTQDGSNLDLTWTSGSGDGRLVIASSGAYLNLTAIVDGEVYPANPIYGNESTSLAAGETHFTSHLVANGDVSTVGITDLTPGQTYYFTIIEYEEIGVDDYKYDLQGAVTSSFQMEKLDQTISFANPGETLANETVTLDATSTSGLEVGYSVSGTASISGSDLIFNGAGEVTLTIFQNGNTIYNPAEEEVVVFNVIKADQDVTFDLPNNATYLDDPIMVTPATSSGNIALDYAITGPGNLNIVEFLLTVTGAGTIEVTVSNDGNNIYNPVSYTETITVAKADHTITVNEIDDITYSSTVTFSYGTDPAYEINTTAPAGKPTGGITISILSGPAEVNETNTQQLTVTGVGTVEFEVTNEGNENFNPAPAIQGSFEAVKADQGISINGSIPTEISFDEGTYSFEGKLSTASGLYSLIILDGPGFFSGDNMDIYNITETGQVTISAFASSTDNYNVSQPIEIVFDVVKGDQTIAFEGITNETNLNNLIYHPDGFEFKATASSDLDVEFTVTQNAEFASFDGNILTVTSAGQFQITMSQAGNEHYNAAQDVIEFIAVQAADQTITYEEVPDKLKTDDPFEIIAESSAGLELNYSIVQGNNISLDENVVTINPDEPAGNVIIEVSSQGNAVYNPAPTVSLSFCISPVAPALTINDNIISSDNMVDQHEWYKDGEFLQVSDNSNNTFTTTESGTYKALARGGACPSSDFSNEILYEEMALGLSDELKTLIYPVPTKDFLNVDQTLWSKKNLNFEIFNLSGKQLLSGKLMQQLDVSGLNSGVYYLRIPSELIQIPFIKK